MLSWRSPRFRILVGLLGIAVIAALAIGIRWFFSTAQQEKRGGEIESKWRDAFASVHTIRGSQEVMQIQEDGTAQPIAVDQRLRPFLGSLRGTDEEYELVGDSPYKIVNGMLQARWENIRYHVVAHTTLGDIVMVWNGQNGYRYYSWIDELYTDMPTGNWDGSWWKLVGAYPLLFNLAPLPSSPSSPNHYRGVDALDAEGRKIIQLHPYGSFIDSRMYPQGVQIDLEADAVLPYHAVRQLYLFYPFESGGGIQSTYQWTISKLEVNLPLEESEFTLPFIRDHVILDEYNPVGKSYESLSQAAAEAGTTLYLPRDAQVKGWRAAYSFTKEGKRYAVVTIYVVTGLSQIALEVSEGLYRDRLLDPCLGDDPSTPTQTVFIDGQAVKLPLTESVTTLCLTKGTTQIEIGGQFYPESAAKIVQSFVAVQ